MKTILIYTLSALMILLSGCNKDKIPGVYRVDIQQGNAITQDMINQLKSGMTKKQVAYVMGTPLLIDTFHPNRWDYIYSTHPGNGSREQRKLTLFFNNDDQLDFIKGDTRVVAREDLPQTERSDVNVIVPLQEKNIGLFQGLVNSLGFGEDEAETAIIASTEEELTPELMDIAEVTPEVQSPIDTLDDSATMIDDADMEIETDIEDESTLVASAPEEETGLFQGLLDTVGLGDDDTDMEVSTETVAIVNEDEIITDASIEIEDATPTPPSIEQDIESPSIDIAEANVEMEAEIDDYEEEKTGLFKRLYNSFGIGDYAYDE